MDRNTKIKLGIIIVTIGVCIYLLIPTIQMYTMEGKTKGVPAYGESEKKALKHVLNLGLDLRGGTHLVYELDETKLSPGEKVSDAVERAIEIIRNRVDQLGVREPLIVKQGEKWIAVQLPGIKEPEVAKEVIGKTALLEFRLVEPTGAIQKIGEKIRELGISWEDVYTSTSNISEASKQIKPELLSLFPTGYVLFPGKDGYFLLRDTPEITGAYLINAQVRISRESNIPYVEIEFNREGAKIFDRVTSANINRNLAIVLDNVVQSAPVIRTRIPDGKAVIESDYFTLEDAKKLAIVLRAGALPAPLKLIEERSVGPSLGEDSIRLGSRATLIAAIIVFLFVVVYYKFSGVVADVALLLNVLIVIALMCYFGFTLTLPGIAGIALTIGMAVDANVLIFERIKEELKQGKTLRVAVDLGYQRATRTILDSNLTTLIAAIFLFQFGTGPVKGFAVTLSIGLLANLFTAIFVTRTIQEIWIMNRGRISI